jgi:hypothetical protein
MSTTNAEGRFAGGLNPQSLPLADLLRILSTLGARVVTEDKLQADVEAGAPMNADGTINLVHYAAWLVKEMGHHGD